MRFILLKSRVRAHTRRSASGAPIRIQEYYNKVQKKPGMGGPGANLGPQMPQGGPAPMKPAPAPKATPKAAAPAGAKRVVAPRGAGEEDRAPEGQHGADAVGRYRPNKEHDPEDGPARHPLDGANEAEAKAYITGLLEGDIPSFEELEAKAPGVKPVPLPVDTSHAGDPVARLSAQLGESFRLSPEETEAVHAVIGARAAAWAAVTGREAGDWVEEHIAAVERADEGEDTHPGDPLPPAKDIARMFEATDLVPDSTVKALLGERPEYLNGVISFLARQREKLVSGRITARDCAKAYFLTASSQGSGSLPLDTLRPKWEADGIRFDIPALYQDRDAQGRPTVRPEEAAAAWLMSPMGQRALDAIERGTVDQEAWGEGMKVRQAFGDDRLSTLNLFGDVKKANQNMAHMRELAHFVNEAKGDPHTIGVALNQLNGIGAGKVGFIKHMLGLGDTPTIDAVEINLWLTGKGDIRDDRGENAKMARLLKETLSGKAVAESLSKRIGSRILGLRDSGVGEDLDPGIFGHIVHHWLWDKAKGLETTHAGMYHALEYAQSTYSGTNKKGKPEFRGPAKAAVRFLEDNRAVIRAFGKADLTSCVHELGHVFRRDLGEEELEAAGDWAGAVAGIWTRDAEEKFARGFESYLARGNAPTAGLKGVFGKFKTWMTSLYSHLKGAKGVLVRVPKEVIPVYDRLLGGEGAIGRRTISSGLKKAMAFLVLRKAGGRAPLSPLLKAMPHAVGAHVITPHGFGHVVAVDGNYAHVRHYQMPQQPQGSQGATVKVHARHMDAYHPALTPRLAYDLHRVMRLRAAGDAAKRSGVPKPAQEPKAAFDPNARTVLNAGALHEAHAKMAAGGLQKSEGAKEPWQMTRDEFATHLPDAEESAHRAADERVARAHSYAEGIRAKGETPPHVDETEIRGIADRAAREWHTRAAGAMRSAAAARDHLRAAFPEAEIHHAGSMGSGRFYGKGPRSFDVDLHAKGLPLPASGGKDTIPLPDNVRAALAGAKKKAHPETLDLFVHHEGKLWGVNQKGLTRKPGAFGKEQRMGANGIRVTGRPMTWDEFGQSFAHDMGTHQRHVEEAVAAGKPVPAHVLSEYPHLSPLKKSRPALWEPDEDEEAVSHYYHGGREHHRYLDRYEAIANREGWPKTGDAHYEAAGKWLASRTRGRMMMLPGMGSEERRVLAQVPDRHMAGLGSQLRFHLGGERVAVDPRAYVKEYGHWVMPNTTADGHTQGLDIHLPAGADRHTAMHEIAHGLGFDPPHNPDGSPGSGHEAILAGVKRMGGLQKSHHDPTERHLATGEVVPVAGYDDRVRKRPAAPKAPKPMKTPETPAIPTPSRQVPDTGMSGTAPAKAPKAPKAPPAGPPGARLSTPEEREKASRLYGVKVPPTSWDLVIFDKPTASGLIGTFLDSKGRRQPAGYTQEAVARRDAKKFQSMVPFGRALPRLRKQVAADLREPGTGKARACAAVVALIDATWIRVGSERYAEENASYGASTLTKAHVGITKAGATLDFRGKHGVRQVKVVTDKTLVGALRDFAGTPGESLFAYNDGAGWKAVNERDIRDYLAPFKMNPKQFRTWHATKYATELLLEAGPPPEGERARAKVAKEVCVKVSERLGNTPAICRSSYINPAVFRAWEKGVLDA